MLEIIGLVIGIYVVMSVIIFILYALDKTAAIKGNRRINESTLHVFALLGGWPGAFIAQKRLRHKTIKQPFRYVFFLTVLVNLSLLLVVLIMPSSLENLLL